MGRPGTVVLLLVVLLLALLLPSLAEAGERTCPACARGMARAEGESPATAHYLCRACDAVLHVDANGRETISLRIDGRRRRFEQSGAQPISFPLPDEDLGHPVNLPGHPVNLPGHPVNLPGHPVNLPAPPVNVPSHPVRLPAAPVSVPAHPVNLPGPPVTLPGHPVNLPSDAVKVPDHPVRLPGHPVRLPGHPVGLPGHPVGTVTLARAEEQGFGTPIERSPPVVRAAPVVHVAAPRAHAPAAIDFRRSN